MENIKTKAKSRIKAAKVDMETAVNKMLSYSYFRTKVKSHGPDKLDSSEYVFCLKPGAMFVAVNDMGISPMVKYLAMAEYTLLIEPGKNKDLCLVLKARDENKGE